jgi:hypothetical protein
VLWIADAARLWRRNLIDFELWAKTVARCVAEVPGVE